MLMLSKNDTKELLVCSSVKRGLYKLPCSFYSRHQLSGLLMKNCLFNPPITFSGYSNLKRLYLIRSLISTDTRSLISTLPSLLILNLRGCIGVQYMNTMPPELKALLLYRSIEAPWQCFHVKTNLSKLQIVLPREAQNEKQLNLTTFLANLPKLESLCLDGFSLKYLSAGIPPVLYLSEKLIEVVLHGIQFSDLDQVSCALCLLKSCPNLQKLNIYSAKMIEG